jgi:hypothetical protein
MLLAVTISTNFEGGSLDQVKMLSATHFRCGVKGEVDQDQRNRQASWYFFRLDGGADRQVTIDLVNLLGEYDYKPGNLAINQQTRPVYSYDCKTWEYFADDEVAWNSQEVSLRLKFRPQRNRAWIAHIVPYLRSDLNLLMREARGSPYLGYEVIGKSAQGRDLLLLTVTGSRAKELPPKVIWLMARQHAWEAGTSWMIDGAIRYLLSSDPQAIQLRNSYVFKILPMCDPDGVARGGVRFNLYGYDLNRNWDVFDARLMPEILAERHAILRWEDAGQPINFFLNLHNSNEDYVEGPFSEGGLAVRQLGERFVRLLSDRTSFVSTTGPRDSLPPGVLLPKGRISADQWLFQKRRIPAFLFESSVQYNPKLKRLRTVEDWHNLGRTLVQILGSLLEVTND